MNDPETSPVRPEKGDPAKARIPLQCYVDDHLRRRLKAAAAREGISMRRKLEAILESSLPEIEPAPAVAG